MLICLTQVRAKGLTLVAITESISEMIVERWQAGLNFGVVLIPEGLIEFIPEMGELMKELNELLASRDSDDSNACVADGCWWLLMAADGCQWLLRASG